MAFCLPGGGIAYKGSKGTRIEIHARDPDNLWVLRHTKWGFLFKSQAFSMDNYLKSKLTYIGDEDIESAYVNRFKTWSGYGFNKLKRESLNLAISMVASTVINSGGLMDNSRTAKWQDG